MFNFVSLTFITAIFYVSSVFSEPNQSLVASADVPVKVMTTNLGVKSWGVKNIQVPLISISIGFRNAGYKADPKGKRGLTYVLSGLHDEGAGEYDARALKEFLLEKKISFTAKDTNDYYVFQFKAVKENIEEIFKIFNLMITKPHFKTESINIVKNQVLTLLNQSLHSEKALLEQKTHEVLFGKGHPYVRPLQEMIQDVPNISAVDLNNYIKERFSQDQIVISVAGNFDEKQVISYMEKYLKDLPQKAKSFDVQHAQLSLGQKVFVPLDVPQSHISFTHPGIKRNDPDFLPFYVLIRVLTGAVIETGLWREIREKRGLTYHIDGDMVWNDHAEYVLGRCSTKQENVQQVIDLIKKKWEEIKTEGVKQEELNLAINFLTGSHALKFNSTQKLSTVLLAYQLDGRDVNYINERNKLLKAITLSDMKRIGEKYIDPGKLSLVIVGREQQNNQIQQDRK